MRNNIKKILVSIATFACAAALVTVPQHMEEWIDVEILYHNPSTGDTVQVEVAAPTADWEAEHARITAHMASIGYTKEIPYDDEKNKQAFAQGVNSGDGSVDVLVDMYKNEGVLDDNAHTADASAILGEDESAKAPAAQEESQPEAETQAQEEAPDEVFEHGVYDGLTEEAFKAYEHFLNDGVKDSCYIQVKADAENKVMPAYRITQTSQEHEDGEIQFVDDDGNIVYSVVFPQIETEEDIDLAMEISEDDGVIKVSPVIQKMSLTDLGYTIKIRLNKGYNPHEYVYVYTASKIAGKTYEENSKSMTDKDGNIELNIRTLQDYYISKKDLLSKEDVKKSSDKAENTETDVENVAPEEKVENTAEEQTKENVIIENEENEENAETDNIEKENDVILPAVIIAAVCLIGCVSFVVYKKKH